MSPEEYYRAVFEQSRDLIIIADMSGHILDVNPAAEKLYGYSLQELRELKPGALMAPERRSSMEKNIDSVADAGDVVLETVHQCKDGTRVFLEAHSTVIDYDGQPAILNILRDITPRRQVEAEIRRLAAIVDSSEDAIFAKELDGTITTWNEGARRLYGYRAEEIIGKNASVLLPPDRPNEVNEILAGIARGERFEHFETLRVAKDGRIMDVSITISPIKDETGEIVGASSVARDISTQKKMEEQLRKANEELAAFASVVSHDLRGPLAAIRMGDETLRQLLEGETSEQARETVEEVVNLMHRSLERADRLIGDLLELAEAGQASRKIETIDVGRVVQRVLEERAADIRQRGITVEVAPDLGEVEADYTHIYQLFANLIGNAIDHNINANPAIRILREPDDRQGRHRYSVCDNGTGVSEENMEKVFAPFFKGKSGGSGIGLAIVEKIVKVYDGDIGVHNEDGACFDLSLSDLPADS